MATVAYIVKGGRRKHKFLTRQQTKKRNLSYTGKETQRIKINVRDEDTLTRERIKRIVMKNI